MQNMNNPESMLNKRISEVFPKEVLNELAPQQRNLISSAIKRVLEDESPEALTIARLQGIKELATEHLWSPELTKVAESIYFLEGFKSLSLDKNLFEAPAKQAFLSQLLDSISLFTSKVRTFPVAIAIRTDERFIVMFRRADEDKNLTESTIRAMVAAYDAVEIAICFSTHVYQGNKACLITRSTNTQGTAIFLEMNAEPDNWVIGKPVAKIDCAQLNDFIGREAITNFNDPFIRSRKQEAQQSLEQWMPSYKWGFAR
jgi:hypothetical protein